MDERKMVELEAAAEFFNRLDRICEELSTARNNLAEIVRRSGVLGDLETRLGRAWVDAEVCRSNAHLYQTLLSE